MSYTLEITKEIKQVTFKYVASTYEFVGTCNVTSDKEVTNISTTVNVAGSADTTTNPVSSIGSCSSNGSTNVNIYNEDYKDKIDEVALHFKTLQADLATKYAVVIFNDGI